MTLRIPAKKCTFEGAVSFYVSGSMIPNTSFLEKFQATEELVETGNFVEVGRKCVVVLKNSIRHYPISFDWEDIVVADVKTKKYQGTE